MPHTQKFRQAQAPGDFARFLDHSRASLLEVKNAIGEGLERGYFREMTASMPTR
jgi:hypothetical protein